MEGSNKAAQIGQQKCRVTAAEFKAKFSDKPETYKFMAYEVGAYLPHYDLVTIWHLRDLASGKRKMIKGDKVKKIFIPQYEGLTVDKMLANAQKFPQVMKCLPTEISEIKKLPREYLGNIIYTVIGEPFRTWVDQRVDQRNEKIVEDQNLAIELDPEVYDVFKASSHVSGK